MTRSVSRVVHAVGLSRGKKNACLLGYVPKWGSNTNTIKYSIMIHAYMPFVL